MVTKRSLPQTNCNPSLMETVLSFTVGVEASALADGVPVLDVLPPASSKWVRPVLPNKKRKTS